MGLLASIVSNFTPLRKKKAVLCVSFPASWLLERPNFFCHHFFSLRTLCGYDPS